jgi:hypothetical protein
MKILDKLIIIIVVCTVGYVGITFANCNFMVPGSIESANAEGKLQNPPSIKCEDSIDRGYNALFTLFTALLGLKAKMED